MLFYNSFIRYLIKSNLILTHNAFIFLAFLFSFDSLSSAITTLFNLVILAVVVVWPIAITWILITNLNKLETPEFKAKFISLYLGIKTEK